MGAVDAGKVLKRGWYVWTRYSIPVDGPGDLSIPIPLPMPETWNSLGSSNSQTSPEFPLYLMRLTNQVISNFEA